MDICFKHQLPITRSLANGIWRLAMKTTIADLIEKHNNPVFANAPTLPPITRNFNDNNARTRFNTCGADAGEDGAAAAYAYNDEYTDMALLTSLSPQEPSKDAGTLFREAYYKLNKSRSDVELKEIKNSSKTDLL